MRRTKVVLGVTLAVLGAYLVAVLFRSIVLVEAGGPVALALAAGLVVLVAVAGWAVAVELRFGFATQRLGRRLAEEGGLPVDDLPRSAGGRVDRERADLAFARYRGDSRPILPETRVF